MNGGAHRATVCRIASSTASRHSAHTELLLFPVAQPLSASDTCVCKQRPHDARRSQRHTNAPLHHFPRPQLRAARRLPQERRSWGGSQLNKYIGMDVTSLLSVPVWIMEPFTMLQKMAEVLEYTELLDEADACDDPHDRCAALLLLVALSWP